jgi:transcriptional regulator with XRE-family HTH domain
MENPTPDHQLKRFGQNLEAAREQAGLSLGALATECGLTADEISDLEAGRVEVVASRIVMLAAALGILPDELLAGIDDA